MSIQGQGHFLTLAQGHLHMKINTCFSQKPLEAQWQSSRASDSRARGRGLDPQVAVLCP